MSTEVNDYISVSQKLESFGIPVPDGLTLLPANLAGAESIQDLHQHVESDTVRTLLRANGIDYVEIFDEDHQPSYLQQYGSDWFGPTVFVTAGLLSQNPDLLSVTFGLITNYLYDYFKGVGDVKASLNVVYERADGTCKQITYSGPPAGMSEIAKIVKALDSEG